MEAGGDLKVDSESIRHTVPSWSTGEWVELGAGLPGFWRSKESQEEIERLTNSNKVSSSGVKGVEGVKILAEKEWKGMIPTDDEVIKSTGGDIPKADNATVEKYWGKDALKEAEKADAKNASQETQTSEAAASESKPESYSHYSESHLTTAEQQFFKMLLTKLEGTE